MTVGVLADTHGRLEPAVLRIFAGAALILHAGDIGTPEVLRALEAVAPVRAVLGNVDDPHLVGRHPVRCVEDVGVLVTHAIGSPERLAATVRRAVARERPRVVVFGHSHRMYLAEHAGVLFLNPGGAGPRRFGLPRSVALLRVREGNPAAEIVFLDGDAAGGSGERWP
jgi:hypothetical protein